MKKLITLSLLYSAMLPFSAQSQEKIIFSEDFSNNSRKWDVYDDTLVKWKIENGKYYRQNFKNFSYVTFKPVDINIDNNFSISLTTTDMVSLRDGSYGLLFGARDINNWFGFLMSTKDTSGYFKILKNKEAVTTDLVKWTKTPAIKRTSILNIFKIEGKKEDKKDNVLMIKKQGGDWKFYINDQFVTGMPAEPFFGYGFGIYSSGLQPVTFDDLVIKESNASATVVKEDVLLNEDFSLNTRKWPEADNENRKQKVSNGKYNWDNIKGGSYSLTQSNLNQRGDYSISVKAAHTNGEEQPFGICFGFLDVNNLFEFDIYADGYYVLYKMMKGKDTMLIKDVYSSAIKTGNNAVNDLKIKKEGNLWKLYINEVMVATHPALDFFGNKTGMVVYEKQKIEFDDLIVKQLIRVEAPPMVKTVSTQQPVSNTNAVTNTNEPFTEDFSANTKNWSTLKNDSAEIQLKDGKYLCDNKKSEALISTQSLYLQQAYNYSISISTSHISGVNTGGYGLLFGHGSANAYYAFEITGEGNFRVIKTGRGNSVQELVKWTTSPAIKKGNNTVNILTLQKDSTTWKFLINNQQVATFPSERLIGSGFGMMVKQKQLIAFDNFEIKRNQGTYAPPTIPRNRTRN